VTNKKIMIVVVSIALMYALHLFVRKTRWGMAMRAMAFDYVVVPLLGVPINNIARMTFAIGSALAAVAGIFFGVAYPVLDPYMGIIAGLHRLLHHSAYFDLQAPWLFRRTLQCPSEALS
ncbi:MAG: hypothetical protein P8017_16870, partial [Deltaproteobacteria bacterium]